MKDYLHSFLKWISYNRYLVIGIVICIALTVGIASCASTTGSIVNPGTQVDRDTFVIEAMQAERGLESMRESIDGAIADYNASVEQFNARIDIGVTDLDQQDEIKAQAFSHIEGIITGMVNGTFNPASLLIPGLGLGSLFLGAGAWSDKKRTDKVLKANKYGVTEITKPTTV